MENNFRTFDEVENPVLKAFNRVVLLTNITIDFGKEAAVKYGEQFSEGDKKAMYFMSELIKRKGVEETKREILSQIEPELADDEV